MNHFEKAVAYVREHVDMADVAQAKVKMGEKNPLFRINHTLCDDIYDLMEEYGADHDLPEGWWLDEADEEEVLLRL